MRFLLDESADLPLADYLRAKGHDVTTIVDDYTRSIRDTEVLSIAVSEQRVLITNDKDFGELVFHRSIPHRGIILFPRLYCDGRLRYRTCSAWTVDALRSSGLQSVFPRDERCCLTA